MTIRLLKLKQPHKLQLLRNTKFTFVSSWDLGEMAEKWANQISIRHPLKSALAISFLRVLREEKIGKSKEERFCHSWSKRRHNVQATIGQWCWGRGKTGWNLPLRKIVAFFSRWFAANFSSDLSISKASRKQTSHIFQESDNATRLTCCNFKTQLSKCRKGDILIANSYTLNILGNTYMTVCLWHWSPNFPQCSIIILNFDDLVSLWC